MDQYRKIRKSSGWAIALGVLMIVMGIIAIASPFIASIATGLFLGWLFIAGAIIQAVYAFQQNRGRSQILKLLLSLLYLIVGIMLVANPFAGVISLTLAIGIFYFVDGIFRTILAFQLKPTPRWGLVLVNGILMIILGILIWSQWPSNASWILGFLVGIGLLVNGITILFIGAEDQWSSS